MEGYDCDGVPLDCLGNSGIPVIDYAGFTQVSESENCFEYNIFSNANIELSNFDLSAGNYIYVDLDNINLINQMYPGEGIFKINSINDFGAFIKIQVSKNIVKSSA